MIAPKPNSRENGMLRCAALILCLFLPAAIAQTPPCLQMNCYTATTGVVALTAQTTAATIQQPAAAPYQQVFGIKATVYCSVTCTATRSYGGTAATVTAGTVNRGQNVRPAPLLLFFTGSDSSGGTTVDASVLAAGETRIFDLTDVRMGGAPNANYTISISSITGNVIITFYVGLQ